MDTSSTTPSGPIAHELKSMREHWWWFLVLGISLLILGMISIGSGVATMYVTAITVVFFGFLLLISGLAQVVSSFWAGQWSGFLVHLLVGILYTVVGYQILDKPDIAVAMLTLLIAALLIVGGIFKIIGAMAIRFHDWGWVLLSGIISVLLGIMINEGWPASSLFVIGLFVGIELIFNGWSWIMFSVSLRQSDKLAEETESAAPAAT